MRKLAAIIAAGAIAMVAFGHSVGLYSIFSNTVNTGLLVSIGYDSLYVDAGLSLQSSPPDILAGITFVKPFEQVEGQFTVLAGVTILYDFSAKVVYAPVFVKFTDGNLAFAAGYAFDVEGTVPGVYGQVSLEF